MLSVVTSERVSRLAFFILFLGLVVVEWLLTTAVAPVPDIPFDAHLGLYAAMTVVGFVWSLAQHYRMRYKRKADEEAQKLVSTYTWPMWALTAVAAFGLLQYIIYVGMYRTRRDLVSPSLFLAEYVALVQTAQYTVTFTGVILLLVLLGRGNPIRHMDSTTPPEASLLGGRTKTKARF